MAAGAAPDVGQLPGVELHQLGNVTQQLPLECAVGHGAPARAGVAGHVGAALCRAQVAAFAGGLDQEAAQRHGVGHKPGERVLAKCADKAVGVVFGGQKQKLDAAGVGGVGQGAVQRLVGRAPPGGVAVEAEHHRIGETKKLLHMVVGAGRAQRGHGVGQAVLGQRHHVHVTLGDQGVTLFAQRATGFKQAVQLAAFAEHGGFG